MKNIYKNLSKWHWVLFMIVLISTGCQDDEDDNTQPDGSEYFVSAESKGTVTKAQLQLYAQFAGFGRYADLIDYDVAFYRFVYKTTYKEQTIDASGLLAIPQNTPTPAALASAQHGTMFRQRDAPSNFPLTFSGFEIMAANGYITVIPDFIGFGVSSDIVHPYYDEAHSAATVVDMLKAAKFYLQRENIATNNNLFLVGYSEGGYVTLAAQKEIEANPDHGLQLTAVAAGAGGYDLTGMLNGIATTTTYEEPSFLALILNAYNTTYAWNRPLTDFFREPYASRLPTLLNGSNSREQINSELTTSPAALFNPTFYANLQNASGEPALKQKLTENSLLDWVPKTPTRLYHGTADEAVFYATSETTFNRFKNAGATNVELIPIPGGMHRTSIEPMVVDALPWFETLNK
jgi:pimeloyl-ACP methyl ester carboxylesterase